MSNTYSHHDGDGTPDNHIMQFAPELELTLYIGKDRLMMPFPSNSTLILGRAASIPQTAPLRNGMRYESQQLGDKPLVFRQFLEFLSLTSFDGEAAGVSREHAAIHHESRQLMIEDLSSTNGTFVNNERLLPGQKYLLQHGDTIVLGGLLLRIAYQEPKRQQMAQQQQRTG